MQPFSVFRSTTTRPPHHALWDLVSRVIRPSSTALTPTLCRAGIPSLYSNTCHTPTNSCVRPNQCSCRYFISSISMHSMPTTSSGREARPMITRISKSITSELILAIPSSPRLHWDLFQPPSSRRYHQPSFPPHRPTQKQTRRHR